MRDQRHLALVTKECWLRPHSLAVCNAEQQQNGVRNMVYGTADRRGMRYLEGLAEGFIALQTHHVVQVRKVAPERMPEQLQAILQLMARLGSPDHRYQLPGVH
eukprot:3112646-Rhodomonas_salina.2